MFSHHDHPYVLQVAALWFSFVPPFAIITLVAGAQIERLKRCHGSRR